MELLSTLQQADLRLFGWLFRSGQRRLLIAPAKAFSHSGDGYLHIAVPLLLIAMGVEAAGELILVLLLALAMERPLYWLLKNSLKRRRPQARLSGVRSLIVASDQFSFPSGHSSGAFLLATSTCLIYGGAAAVMYVWAVGVALSRVILGVHFPGDLLAGATMGVSLSILSAITLGLFHL